MKVILGNELRFAPSCVDWLEEGVCRTLGDSRYLLVDFSEGEQASVIEKGLMRLLNAGVTPILAHAERYFDLWGKHKLVENLRISGVLIQVDTQSVTGDFGFRTKRAAKQLLSRHLVDFIGSDAHDLTKRPPGIQKAYQIMAKKYGQEYAEAVCGGNAERLLVQKIERKRNDE